jgi:ABC-type multidrug transport system fused ATPase/permease subunit
MRTLLSRPWLVLLALVPALAAGGDYVSDQGVTCDAASGNCKTRPTAMYSQDAAAPSPGGPFPDTDGDGVSDDNDPRPYDPTIDGLLNNEFEGLPSRMWPPRPSHLPVYGLAMVLVWAALFYLSREEKTEADRAAERRRLRDLQTQMQQANDEYDKTKKELDEYVAIEKMLRLQAGTEEAFQELIRTSGFIKQDKPSLMRAERPFKAIFVTVEAQAANKLGILKLHAKDLGDGFVASMDALFNTLFAIMTDRIISELKDVMKKTEDAQTVKTSMYAREDGSTDASADATTASYRSGHKLDAAINLAKKIQMGFYPRRYWGLLASAPIHDEDPAAFLGELKRAEVMLKGIRARQSYVQQAWGLVSRRMLVYLSITVLMVWAEALVRPMIKIYSSKIMDDAVEPAWEEKVLEDIVILVIGFITQTWVINIVHSFAERQVEAEFDVGLRNKVFKAILRQDTAMIHEQGEHAIQAKLQSVDEVRHALFDTPMRVLQNVLAILGEVWYLSVKCPGMLGPAIVTVLVAVPIVKLVQSVVKKRRKQTTMMTKAAEAKISETLQNLSVVREFAREDQAANDFSSQERIQTAAVTTLRLMNQFTWPVMHTLIQIGTWYNLYSGAAMVNLGEMKATDVIGTQHAVSMIAWRLRGLIQREIPALIESLSGVKLEPVFSLIESKSSIEPNEGDAPKQDFVIPKQYGCTGGKKGGIDIDLQDVTFAYPMLREHNILRHMNLHIPAGKTVALVGEAGCGKSTTLQICLRGYDVDQGKVVVNGKLISDWNVRQYRRAIAVVSQEIKLFKGTIKENILYGLSDEDRRAQKYDGPETNTTGRQKLIEVAEKACAWSFIEKFPLQFETRIGTGGIELSGGQKQRIAIARALAKEPACLILDEATSALDAKNQKLVAENIAKEQRRLGFTIIQIAHRLETLLTSDVVHFIEHGAVVETGKTDDGTACKQLREKTVTRKTVKHPLTEKEVEIVTGGYFRDLWDSAHPDEASKAQSGGDKDAQIKQLEADLNEAREAKKRVSERLVLTRWNQAFSAAKEEAVPLEQPQSPGLSQMLLMSMGIDGVASPPEFVSGFQAHATRASTR